MNHPLHFAKTKEVTNSLVTNGVSYIRVFSERRKPTTRDHYQRVKVWGVYSHKIADVKAAFEAAGARNVRVLRSKATYLPGPTSVAGDFYDEVM